MRVPVPRRHVDVLVVEEQPGLGPFRRCLPIVRLLLEEQERATGAHSAIRPTRSACPVSRTFDVLGDRGLLLVVRELMRGTRRFAKFTESKKATLAEPRPAATLGTLASERGIAVLRRRPGRMIRTRQEERLSDRRP